ncbi:selenocysteine-specific translation elongation factor [Blautia schinkii]|nr:selenocysteine-specific translation elongation factor [Blautia schinkii]
MAGKNHVIIGTAGHVDHGKTCLVQALTGIDTDRLKEEKKRGITIELGFAYLKLPGGDTAGIIDVPGHEKFIKNMLAGAGGIDIAMLVVAADEGVMPQTVEHLEILKLLDIQRGVIAITKADAADPELCQLVEEDVRELVRGTFLETAPIVITSAHTGEGIDALRETLCSLCAEAEQKRLKEPFRLPIDRVFTMKGFGTVVTGTLIEGSLSLKDEAMLYPSGEVVKVRSIQVHGQETDKAFAGQRAAVNIANRRKEEISRGEVLALSGSMEKTMMADVKLKLIKSAAHSVKNGSRVHLYHGSRDLLCKVVLMEQDVLEPGEEGYAQLRLEEETVFKTGDRFVIRFYSPVETVGGGIVLDACPRKHRRNRPEVLKSMEIKDKGDIRARMEEWVLEYGMECVPAKTLAQRAGLERTRALNELRVLKEEGRVVEITAGIFFHEAYLTRLGEQLTGRLDEYHKSFPLKEGMPLEEVRGRLGLPAAEADGVLEYLCQKRQIKIKDALVSNFRFRVVRNTDDKALYKQINSIYLKSGFQPPSTEELKAGFAAEKRFTHVFSSMIAGKNLVRLDEKHFIHKDYYEKALEGLKELNEEKGQIILGEYRDFLGISRKHAVSLLESFDRSGITRKNGDVRILK